jgi:Domain of unknown function (DUF397)
VPKCRSEPTSEEPVTGWIKAKASDSNGSCVEVRQLDDGCVQVRNSRKPHIALTAFTRAEWAAFLDGARNGEFDQP